MLTSYVPTLLAVAVTALVVYGVGLAIYRLYFHPLARFPGSSLTAATLWYEFYQDVVCGGQMTRRIEEWHEKYGPIVRINPWEISIRDKDFYGQLYSQSQKLDKLPWYYSMGGDVGSAFMTHPHELHRIRRKAVSRFFSRRAVDDLEYVIQNKIDKFCEIIAALATQKLAIDLESGFRSLTTDIIMEYALPRSNDLLSKPGFAQSFHQKGRMMQQVALLSRYFPIIMPIMESSPHWLVKRMDPDAFILISYIENMREDVKAIIRSQDDVQEKLSERQLPTVLHEICNNAELSVQDKGPYRVACEGFSLVGAGSDTTARTLTYITYELLKAPELLARLKKELEVAIPSPKNPPKHAELEKLPFLSAVIKEGLRLSNPLPTRLPRVVPQQGLSFQGWHLPPGSGVSTNARFLHEDPDLFPEPKRFIPERWLDAKDGQRLESYLVPFSAGPRMCLGINLAWTELYLTLANVIRKFDFELYKTTDLDIEITHDYFVGFPKADSIGLFVKAK